MQLYFSLEIREYPMIDAFIDFEINSEDDWLLNIIKKSIFRYFRLFKVF